MSLASSIKAECQKPPRSSGGKRSAPVKESSSKDADASGKLERRASLRRKFGALLRGSADLPAAINRGLRPIRRSLSFSKDLHRTHETAKPYRTSSVQWYNSLGSLAEDESVDETGDADYERTSASEEEIFDGRVQVTRTRSLVEKNPVRVPLVAFSEKGLSSSVVRSSSLAGALKEFAKVYEVTIKISILILRVSSRARSRSTKYTLGNIYVGLQSRTVKTRQ